MNEKQTCKECGVGLRNDPSLGLVHPVYGRCSMSNRVVETGEVAAVAKPKPKPKPPSTGPQIPPMVDGPDDG